MAGSGKWIAPGPVVCHAPAQWCGLRRPCIPSGRPPSARRLVSELGILGESACYLMKIEKLQKFLSLMMILITMQKQHQTIVQDIIARHANPASDEPPIIMVLPLANANKNPEKNYFSMGLSLDLIDNLSRLESIHVISPGSVTSFQNEDLDPIDTASALGADYVIYGLAYISDEQVSVDITLSDSLIINRYNAVHIIV